MKALAREAPAIEFDSRLEIYPVPSCFGYGVDELGNVYSRWRGPHLREEWKRKAIFLVSRYLRVGAARKMRTVHRMVAEAFHGPCPEGKEVEHINGDRMDNRPSNLRYVSHVENEASKRTHGTDPAGERNGNSRLTWDQVRDIRSRPRGRGTGEKLAREFGVSGRMIYYIRIGKHWKEAV